VTTPPDLALRPGRFLTLFNDFFVGIPFTPLSPTIEFPIPPLTAPGSKKASSHPYYQQCRVPLVVQRPVFCLLPPGFFFFSSRPPFFLSGPPCPTDYPSDDAEKPFPASRNQDALLKQRGSKLSAFSIRSLLTGLFFVRPSPPIPSNLRPSDTSFLFMIPPLSRFCPPYTSSLSLFSDDFPPPPFRLALFLFKLREDAPYLKTKCWPKKKGDNFPLFPSRRFHFRLPFHFFQAFSPPKDL